MSYPKDVEVEVTFLPVTSGGLPFVSPGWYRPQVRYDRADTNDWDAVFHRDDSRIVDAGETVTGYLAFLSPRAHLGRLAPGTPFTFRVGQRTVATGHILRILELPESAERGQD